MRIVTIIAIGALIIGCKGEGILSGSNVLQAQKGMVINDGGFTPSAIAVAVNDTVRFNWGSNNTYPHQVVVSGCSVTPVGPSPLQLSGSWSTVVTAVGSCTVADGNTQFSGNTGSITILAH